MNARFTESIVEEAALAWFEGLGYSVTSGPIIAPGETHAERARYDQVVLIGRLQQALQRLNPTLPISAIGDTLRKLTRPDQPSLILNNHAIHRLLVEGITVEYQRNDGTIAGAQAKVIDYEQIDNNDWLVVNQFTVVERTHRQSHERRPDIVVFVNGLPLAVFELKNAADEKATQTVLEQAEVIAQEWAVG